MPGGPRQWLHRIIPSHFNDPVGLARRLLGSRDPDAYAAIGHAALGALCTPLDLWLARGERRLYAAAAPPTRPLLFVCGPPRSGTTLVAQALVAHLPVAWLSNLFEVFPRAPLRARQLFGHRLHAWQANYRSYYGRSRTLDAPSDSLPLWDRWLGHDRTRVRTGLTPAERDAIQRFFGALEHLTGQPLVAKNNNLNLQAEPVAEALPTARFLCLDREPVFLAQALLLARREIHGSATVPYGLHPSYDPADDPVTSVCRQVVAHRTAAARLVDRLGPARARVLSYEQFCEAPQAAITEIGRALLGVEAGAGCPMPPGTRFHASRRPRLPAEEFAALEARLAELSGAPA